MRKLSLVLIAFVAYTAMAQAQLLKTEDLYEQWIAGQWSYINNSVYQYNWNLLEDQVYIYEWDSWQTLWIPKYRSLYTYNTDVQLTEKLEQNNNSGWDDVFRELYTYDGDGNLESRTNQYKSNNVWLNNFRVEYTYDSNGNETQVMSYVWDSNNSVWKNSSRGIYTYSNGLVTEQLFEYWDDLASMWLTDGKVVYTYNGDGLVTTYEEQEWVNGGWKSKSKREYSYNSDGNLILIEFFNWDDNSSVWQQSGRVETIYNNDDLPYIETSQTWHNNAWENVNRHTYTYDIYQSTGELKLENISIYPNPASDVLNINLSGIGQAQATVYSADGRMVGSHFLPGKANIVSTGQLPAGNYFISLVQDGKVTTRGFVKE